MPHNLYVTKKY